MSLLARVGGCPRQEWQCNSISRFILDGVPKKCQEVFRTLEHWFSHDKRLKICRVNTTPHPLSNKVKLPGISGLVLELTEAVLQKLFYELLGGVGRRWEPCGWCWGWWWYNWTSLCGSIGMRMRSSWKSSLARMQEAEYQVRLAVVMMVMRTLKKDI